MFDNLKGKYVVIKRGKKKHVAIYVKYHDEYYGHECITLTVNKKGDGLVESKFMVQEKEFTVLNSLKQLL